MQSCCDIRLSPFPGHVPAARASLLRSRWLFSICPLSRLHLFAISSSGSRASPPPTAHSMPPAPLVHDRAHRNPAADPEVGIRKATVSTQGVGIVIERYVLSLSNNGEREDTISCRFRRGQTACSYFLGARPSLVTVTCNAARPDSTPGRAEVARHRRKTDRSTFLLECVQPPVFKS